MASSTPQSELLSIALSGQENMIPAAEERQQEAPHSFLSLAPTLSASYPVKSATPKSPVQTATPNTTSAESAATSVVPSAADIDSELLKTRRSSSLSSNGSLSQKRRFLRLGPVHHDGSHNGDWSEEVIE